MQYKATYSKIAFAWFVHEAGSHFPYGGDEPALRIYGNKSVDCEKLAKLIAELLNGHVPYFKKNFLTKTGKKGVNQMPTSQADYVYFPPFAARRPAPWKYVRWISNDPKNFDWELSFEELIERAKQSDHGEVREVDVYDQGAVCWSKE